MSRRVRHGHRVTKEQFATRVEDVRRHQIMRGATADWWWLSFADPRLPTGSQFLGVAIVEGPTYIDAITRSHALGINPGGQVQSTDIPVWVPPESLRNRLLSRDELDVLSGDVVVRDRA